MVLLLESLESMVDLIEVPEHVLSQLGEPDVHLAEPAVDLDELTSQEFDELLVLGRGYGPYLSQVQTLFKCINHWTSPERVARAKLRQVDQAARQGSHDR